MRSVVICDIDGVIASCEHRLHHIKTDKPNWDAFFQACEDDEPIHGVIELVGRLSFFHRIVYVTGRPERTRTKTTAWLRLHSLPWDGASALLFMRADGDHRPDYQVKRELYLNHIITYPIALVLEDRDQVVDMWRKEGLLCLQPKKGDY